MKKILKWSWQILFIVLFAIVIILLSHVDTVSGGKCIFYLLCWTAIGIMQGLDIQKKLDRKDKK